MKKYDFLPIILGSDVNAYGMARSFHEQYGIKSYAIARQRLFTTDNSKIITVDVCDNFNHADIFIDKLISVAEELKSKAEKLILVASSDAYAELIIRNKSVLNKYYVIPFIDEDLMNDLIFKENFYKTCEKYNLDYPNTFICTIDNKDSIALPFEYPVVIKPSDSLLYFECSFEGKKKAYVVQTKEEFTDIINRIYSSAYNKNLIIQEYIPGDDTQMRVLNCYSGIDGKVKMMCLGRPLLEDYTPSLIGNYTAIINDYNVDIFDKYRRFLEDIGYVGFANFDMKYDIRDGKFKVFEINLRQGRSSYFVTGSGYNLAKYLVEDCIYNRSNELVLAKGEHLWLGVPKGIVLKYTEDDKLRNSARKLINEGKYSYTLQYKKDLNFKRLIKNFRYYFDYYGRYNKYFKKID
ncbi:ATP-grasp domain-containing protein [Serpentinicella alkaliphila]|uniref:D-aspartate ligase n=1 Tax=Serpentinicella alkaliphila TaxID=1734049 RepID=A0A4R2TWG3_9FIRM|nr:ATP-grasp domain-containing protein [Serpentinicella alkaliphila]QUH25902.1 ATP-grasp domain-containing protein [Serpentinicella alkaliphila]TCQ01969.1 D-aspartate ligase [Serpentinicella alkaliphila]